MSEAISEERPWRLQLICCGRDDGTINCATRGDAEVARSAYTDADGHDRQAILTGPDGHETDPAAILAEYLAALGKDLLTSSICGDMQSLLKCVTTDRDQLRARLDEIGETREEWAVRWPDGEINIADLEGEARDAARYDAGLTLLQRTVGQWRKVPDA